MQLFDDLLRVVTCNTRLEWLGPLCLVRRLDPDKGLGQALWRGMDKEGMVVGVVVLACHNC